MRCVETGFWRGNNGVVLLPALLEWCVQVRKLFILKYTHVADTSAGGMSVEEVAIISLKTTIW